MVDAIMLDALEVGDPVTFVPENIASIDYPESDRHDIFRDESDRITSLQRIEHYHIDHWGQA